MPLLAGFDQTGEYEIQNDVTAKSTMTKKCMNCLSRFGIWTRKNCCKGCGRVNQFYIELICHVGLYVHFRSFAVDALLTVFR